MDQSRVSVVESNCTATRFSEEIKNMAHEPLLPVERQLIGWSLAIGLGLLVLLVWISRALFAA